MKSFRISVLLVLTSIFGSANAQGQGDKSQAALLAGSWTSSATRSDGLTIAAAVSLSRNGIFSGHADANGKPFMSYEGTWKLVGKRIFWVYVKSQPEIPENARADSDELMSVDGKSLVLRSDRSGEIRTYQRQK